MTDSGNRRIEEYALNGWPALRTLLLDGWLLRFAEGYTKRSNSINPIYKEIKLTRDICGMIDYCEEQYAKAALNTTFKITPFAPADLDHILEAGGYAKVEPSHVKILDDFGSLKLPDLTEIKIGERITNKWLDVLAELNSLSEKNKAVTYQLLSGSHLKQGYFILYKYSIPVACGLGVIEDNYVGLYDIVTSLGHRNQGYGEQLILHILNWAKINGADKSYLLVLQNNAAANSLYNKIGYKERYTYWYRVKVPDTHSSETVL
ncbi:GNAT family N-acetyltransferase [Paenibacillus solisilvae]|uniref:GNAT family N-acetyltransferase n=1 Tax=Paenibacillus solisilvae TaxID=2486751 RepID=A0ABW0W0N5_9BACL